MLLLDPSERVYTVRSVRVVCSARCAEQHDSREIAVRFAFAGVGDVLDCAERLIPAHDWDRDTVDRFASILAALHARRRGRREHVQRRRR